MMTDYQRSNNSLFIFLSWLLQNYRGHDADLFHKATAFSKTSDATIPLSCTIGPSKSEIPAKYGAFGEGLFPTLSWPAQAGVSEYLLVIEDPDAPLPKPVVHGLYYGIPPTVTSVSHKDLEPVPKGDGQSSYMLRGGFKYGANRRGTVYILPRGMLGHGPHRYFFQLVALRQPIDARDVSAMATKEEILKQIDGKVMGWGCWEGIWERKE